MRLSYLLFALLFSALVTADELSDRIKTGMDKSEVLRILGDKPTSEECSTLAGASMCTLIWKRGFVQKTVYTVTFVLDKTVTVSVKTESLF